MAPAAWEEVLYWLVTQALTAFPPPADGVLYLVVDSTLKGKRTKKNPKVKKGRLNEHAPFTWGLHVVLLIAQWDIYRIPLDFRLVRSKKSNGYRSENALFREMLEALVLPPWCEKVIVVADAAYASRANLKAIQAYSKAPPDRAVLKGERGGEGYTISLPGDGLAYTIRYPSTLMTISQEYERVGGLHECQFRNSGS